MSNMQENEIKLFLIDKHMRHVQVSLDRVKQELIAMPDSPELIEKVDALIALVNELNIITQYRNQILDDLKSKCLLQNTQLLSE